MTRDRSVANTATGGVGPVHGAIMTSFLSTIGSIFTIASLAIGAAGCDESAPRAEAPSAGCAGGKCDDGAIGPLAAPTWLACWNEDGALKCRQPSNAVWNATGIYVQLQPSGEVLPLEPDVEVEIARGSGDVRVWANPNMEALGTSGLITSTVEATVTVPATATRAQPATLAAPFALWPIDLATPEGVAVFNTGDPQALPLAPWTSAGRATLEIDWGAHAQGDHPSRFYVPVPPTGAWRGDLEVITSEGAATGRMAATLTGPGRWIANNSGLRAATEGDASLFSNVPETPVDPSDPTGPTEPAGPSCDDAGYLAWLADYLAAFAAAGDFVSADERAQLEAKLAARACTPDSDAAYVAWHALWKDRFDRALPSATAIVDADERALLDLVLAARPEADGDEAFQTWFAHYTTRLASYLPSDTAIIDGDEHANLALLATARPDTASGLAYVAWLSTWRGYFEAALPSTTAIVDDDERQKLAVVAEVRPAAAGDEAWSAWLDVFSYRLGLVGSYVDDGERGALEVLATVKPCGDAESQARFSTLTGDAAIIALADPGRCE